jgi:hypothetical protein
LHKQPDGSYLVDTPHLKTEFGTQDYLDDNAVEFVLLSNKRMYNLNVVREVVTMVTVKESQS